jgi:malic enzyme
MWQFMPGNRSAWSGTIPPVTVKGKTFVPGQGNNAYIFPGSGLRAVGSEAKRVTDDMYFAAAKTLANPASEEDLAEGRIYPGPGRIREESAANAAVVAGVSFQRGSTTMKRPADLSAHGKARMHDPTCEEYLSRGNRIAAERMMRHRPPCIGGPWFRGGAGKGGARRLSLHPPWEVPSVSE